MVETSTLASEYLICRGDRQVNNKLCTLFYLNFIQDKWDRKDGVGDSFCVEVSFRNAPTLRSSTGKFMNSFILLRVTQVLFGLPGKKIMLSKMTPEP